LEGTDFDSGGLSDRRAVVELKCETEFKERYSRPTETLQDWLFKPFDPSVLSMAGRREVKCAVLTVCDQQHVRDVYPLVMLARFLPVDRYHSTEFYQVSLNKPNWEGIALDKLTTLCLVGRSSMFRTCKLIEVLPRDLRFTLPGNDEKWRGKPLTGSSIRHYHHVQQNCSGRKPLATQNTDGHGEIERRTFFLYVRRTQINHDLLVRCSEAIVANCGQDAVSGFSHRCIRQANNDNLSVSACRDVYFDIDEVRFDAVNGSTARFEKHGLWWGSGAGRDLI